MSGPTRNLHQCLCILLFEDQYQFLPTIRTSLEWPVLTHIVLFTNGCFCSLRLDPCTVIGNSGLSASQLVDPSLKTMMSGRRPAGHCVICGMAARVTKTLSYSRS